MSVAFYTAKDSAGIEKKAFQLTSLVVDYDPTVPLESWPRPTGGLRILTINGHDLNRCMLVRQILRAQLHGRYNKQITRALLIR